MSSGPQRYTRQFIILPDQLGMNGVDITAEATSAEIGCAGYNQLTLMMNLDFTAATRVDIAIDVSPDRGTTWYTLQTATAAGGGAFTLADSSWQHAIAAADDRWALNIPINNEMIRIRAIGAAATDDLLYITAELAVV